MNDTILHRSILKERADEKLYMYYAKMENIIRYGIENIVGKRENAFLKLFPADVKLYDNCTKHFFLN